MSLSATTDVQRSGFSWWVILLIVIGCILAAAVGVFAIVYLSKKQKAKHQQEAVDLLKQEYKENPT